MDKGAARLVPNLMVKTKPSICLPTPPLFPNHFFSFMKKRPVVACFETKSATPHALSMERASSSIVQVLLVARDAPCILRQHTLRNPLLIGSHRFVGNCPSKWIGNKAPETLRSPLFAGGAEKTGARMANPWRGVAPREPMHMLALNGSLSRCLKN